MKRLLGLTFFLLLALAAGCAPGTDLQITARPSNSPPPGLATATAPPAAPRTATVPAATATAAGQRPTLPAAGATATNSVPADLMALPEVEQARADLALRLNVPPADIAVEAVQPMTWTDSSMGCPQPGMDYLQVLVDGLLITLTHGGQTYAYHSGGDQPPFLCEQPALGPLRAIVLTRVPSWLTAPSP